MRALAPQKVDRQCLLLPSLLPATDPMLRVCTQAGPPSRVGAAQVGLAAAAAAAARRCRQLPCLAASKDKQPGSSKAADLAAEVERLRAENEALRAALAARGGEVTLAAPAAEGEAAAAAAAAGPAAVAAGAAAKPTLKDLEAGIQWPTPEEGSFWERPPRSSPLPLGPPAAAPGGGVRDPHSLHVVHITAEMAPHAKVGGLGDVVTGLARACLGRGHNVEIMLPVSLFSAGWVGGFLLAGALDEAGIKALL